MTAPPFFESRFPVGSSASRIDGCPQTGAGDRHPLLLTTRELARQVLRAVRHLYLLERRDHPFLPLGGSHAAIGQRQLDVLVDREVSDQIEALEDEADLAVSGSGPLGHLEIRHRLTVQLVLAI